MAWEPKYLTPVLTGQKRVKYLVATALWIAAVLYFWSWWLQPEHRIEPVRYWMATVCMGWITFLQAYCLTVFLNGHRSSAPDPVPGQWRVAMVVTKTPGEPLSLLKRTLTAMLDQPYPHDTWLADEDPSEETILWCGRHGVQISTRKGVADYHRAEWPRRTRCKEGNLAYFYDHFGYDNYDIVVQLDADHVPQPGYLQEMLRPFADPDVGYVSAPSICSTNEGESWAARTRLHAEAAFHGLLQSGYTKLFTPTCIGSHYAVRTAALKSAGGLGPDLAEDHSTTLLLAADGWKGVHAIDAIAHGDGPANVADLAVQEFQWSRSLMTIFLRHTASYIENLPGRLKFFFLFGQLWYPTFALTMIFLYVAPIWALLFDARFADVTYPAFIGHSFPTLAVLIWYALQIRKDGLFRPYQSKVLGWEKMLFVYLQWPWALWGCVMAVVDRVRGKFVDFRVTPKGEAASKRLPTRLVMVYATLAFGAILPVILIDGADEARGFHLLSALNALIYCGIVASIVGLHLRENAAELRQRWRTAFVQLGSATALGSLIVIAVMARGTESLYALSVGLEPFRIARAEFAVSGAGISDRKRVHFRFDPGWN